MIEAAIELGAPILQHAGHIHYPLKDQPRFSDGGRIAELAKRYPEAKLICAHLSGGDWEWTIKALRVDVVLTNEIGRLAHSLGADRLAFGSGMPFNYPDIALLKLEALDAPESDKWKIAWGNAADSLKLE